MLKKGQASPTDPTASRWNSCLTVPLAYFQETWKWTMSDLSASMVAKRLRGTINHGLTENLVGLEREPAMLEYVHTKSR